MGRLDQFIRLLRRWNNAIRLVGDVRDEALARHVEDARALLPYLPSGVRIVDVGSGNGFPSIPIAIARPELELTLVEPIAKKVAFLRECRRALQLDNVTVLRSRDNDLANADSFRPFDIAVSQATFPPAEWLVRATPLVKPGGLIIAMLGEDRSGLDQRQAGAGISDLEIHDIDTGDGRARAIALRRVPVKAD